MKKILALLLVAMMLLGLNGTALAYDEDITWQGIPWRSSVEDAVKILIEKGYIKPENESLAIESLILDSGSVFYQDNETVGVSLFGDRMVAELQLNKGALLEETKIAGYLVDRIALTFVYYEDITSLVCVQIMLNENSYSYNYKDLSAKITAVYGDAITDGFVFTWKSNSNSLILMNRLWCDFFYGTLDAEQIALELYGLTNEKENEKELDTSGL